MTWSISGYSLNGPDSVLVPLQSIKAANQIYFNQQHRIVLLGNLTTAQAKENQSLALIVNNCQKERELSDALTNNLRLQMGQKDRIISNQSTMIKILSGITATAVGFTIYKSIK